MNLLATSLGCPRDDQRRPRAWGLRQDAAQHMPCRVYRRFDDKQHFIVGILLAEKRPRVGLEPIINAAAGRQNADHGELCRLTVAVCCWCMQEARESMAAL